MIRKWLEKQLHVPAPVPAYVKTFEILGFLFQKGLGAYLRGCLQRWGFKHCGKNLFVGRSCRFYFKRFIVLGHRVVIAPHCTLNGLSQKGMQIGDGVHIQEYTWIQATSQLHNPGVGLVIGSHTYIGPYGYLGAGGGISIGKDVVIGAHVQILAENHSFDKPQTPIRLQGVTRKGIHLEDNVWVGNNVIILDGVRIGKGCVIGAGSVVTHDVPPDSIAAGNPAKVLRPRGPA